MKRIVDLMNEFIQKDDEELREYLKERNINQNIIICDTCGSEYYRGSVCPNCHGRMSWV